MDQLRHHWIDIESVMRKEDQECIRGLLFTIQGTK